MKRVVVTGRGLVSPVGSSVSIFLDALRNNRTAVAVAPWADEDNFAWWCVPSDFEPSDWVAGKVAEGTDLSSQFAIASALQALRESGIQDLPTQRTAVVHGTSMGGVTSLMRAQHELEQRGPRAVDRKTMIKMLPNMAASQIAMMLGLHGPQLTVSTACASSIDAIAVASGLIQSGKVDVAIVGGTEGGLTRADGTKDGDFRPVWFYTQTSYGMTTGDRDPSRAMIPFDTARRGIVTGDGSAFVVIESEEYAVERGASIFAEVRGCATLADGYHPSSPDPSGVWEAEVMRQALNDAGISPLSIDAVYAHGTGTPKGDQAEIRAINAVHGGRQLPVTSIKGHTGHTGAASALMSLISATETFERGTFPNVAGTRDVEDEVDFRVVLNEPITIEANFIQVNAFGFGGQDASMVLQKYHA